MTFSARFGHWASRTQEPAPTHHASDRLGPEMVHLPDRQRGVHPRSYWSGELLQGVSTTSRSELPTLVRSATLASTGMRMKHLNLGCKFWRCHCCCTSLPFNCVVTKPSLLSAVTNTNRPPFQRFNMTFSHPRYSPIPTVPPPKHHNDIAPRPSPSATTRNHLATTYFGVK